MSDEAVCRTAPATPGLLKRAARRDFPLKNSETLTPDWFGVYTAWVKRAASLEVSC